MHHQAYELVDPVDWISPNIDFKIRSTALYTITCGTSKISPHNATIQCTTLFMNYDVIQE